MKITHLGDSRIYGVNTHLKIFTDDHNDPIQRNMLTKCLGLDRLSIEDFYEKKIENSPSRILLCTDGFYHVMEAAPELFLHILNMPEISDVKHKISKSMELRNYDDATYLLVSMNIN